MGSYGLEQPDLKAKVDMLMVFILAIAFRIRGSLALGGRNDTDEKGT